MSEREMEHLYELLDKTDNEDEKAALRHAILVLETNHHIY